MQIIQFYAKVPFFCWTKVESLAIWFVKYTTTIFIWFISFYAEEFIISFLKFYYRDLEISNFWKVFTQHFTKIMLWEASFYLLRRIGAKYSSDGQRMWLQMKINMLLLLIPKYFLPSIKLFVPNFVFNLQDSAAIQSFGYFPKFSWFQLLIQAFAQIYNTSLFQFMWLAFDFFLWWAFCDEIRTFALLLKVSLTCGFLINFLWTVVSNYW